MKRIEQSFKTFLERTGGLTPIKLGKSLEVQVTQEDRDSLLKDLRENMKFNRVLVLLLVFMHILLFGAALAFCWFKGADKEYLGLLLGGSGAGVYALLTGLRVLWREKVIMDMAVAILPNLPPKQAVEVIQILYYRLKKRRG